jgi:uncharacterized protein YdeI (YjbR/CyaY-like superfamily)
MDIGKTFYAKGRKEWRAWLSKNHGREKEIWLVYYKKASGKPRIPYNDAVEEALCFGWIDSTVKSIDEEKFAQRFSKRNPKSRVSEMNKERIRMLVKNGKMTRAGLDAVALSFNPKKDMRPELRIAKDILEGLKADEQAWENFQKFPEGYKRVRIGYIESQRRHGEEAFKKSLRHFVKKTAKNARIGFVRE